MRLIQIVKYTFCFVSMILTSLFALSLSGVASSDVMTGSGLSKILLAAGLFILIGCCIDFGKYLFWSERQRSHYYGAMALVLTGFSLLASCAFFLSAEFVAINNSRLESTEYRVLQERADAIRQEINHHERLLEKRLNSEFHRQWVEGEKNAERIRELKGSLIRLMELSSNAGKNTAMNEVPITRFFTVLGRIFGVNTETARGLGYGLLALLLEVITLGAISLANSMQHDVWVSDKESDDSTKSESTIDDSEQRRKMVNLSNDIVRGQIQPVIRKIKAAQYELDIDEIRQVLMHLYLAGLIDKDARNSYNLVDLSKP